MDQGRVEETSYKLSGDFLANAATMALLSSFKKAMALDHKLTPHVVGMTGMSGRKYRYLINNLIAATYNARYLEVGSWAGSTACSAMDGNQLKARCIDNWSEFGGPKDDFMSNVNRVKTDKVDFEFIESDFRKVDYAKLGKFNVYLFDGPHTEEDQYDGVIVAQPALDDLYTLIVDDWNWGNVRQGTLRAIGDTGAQILCALEVFTTQDGSHPQQSSMERSEWHNGYFITVCQKKAK